MHACTHTPSFTHSLTHTHTTLCRKTMKRVNSLLEAKCFWNSFPNLIIRTETSARLNQVASVGPLLGPWLSASRENSVFATGPAGISEYTRALFLSVRPSVCLSVCSLSYLSLHPEWLGQFPVVCCRPSATSARLYVMAGSSMPQTSGQTPSVWADMENNKHNGDIHRMQTHEHNLPSDWFVVLSKQRQNIRILFLP